MPAASLIAVTALLLLLLSPRPAEARLVAAVRPLGAGEQRQFVTFRPRSTSAHHRDRRFFRGGREVKGCKPRGFRPPPSAPSRYVNYNTLGSTMCGTAGGRRTSSPAAVKRVFRGAGVRP